MIDYTELYHHGVKGQKWGVTRTPEQLGHPVVVRRKKDADKLAKASKYTAKWIADEKAGKTQRAKRMRKRAERHLASYIGGVRKHQVFATVDYDAIKNGRSYVQSRGG